MVIVDSHFLEPYDLLSCVALDQGRENCPVVEYKAWELLTQNISLYYGVILQGNASVTFVIAHSQTA